MSEPRSPRTPRTPNTPNRTPRTRRRHRRRAVELDHEGGRQPIPRGEQQSEKAPKTRDAGRGRSVRFEPSKVGIASPVKQRIVVGSKRDSIAALGSGLVAVGQHLVDIADGSADPMPWAELLDHYPTGADARHVLDEVEAYYGRVADE